MDRIPVDDITQRYVDADEGRRDAVSMALSDNSVGGMFAIVDAERTVTLMVSCDGYEAASMIYGTLDKLTEQYGKVWLRNVLEMIQRLL